MANHVCMYRNSVVYSSLYTIFTLRLRNALSIASPIRDHVFVVMSDLGIAAKLIRLCRMTLSNSCRSVNVGIDLSEPFDTVQGFSQGDPLSCDLFN